MDSKDPLKNSPPIFIHPKSYVESGCSLGNGVKVFAWTHILPGAVVGEGTMIAEHCYVSGNTRIGKFCRIQNGVQLFDSTIVGDSVFLGPRVVVCNVKKPKADRKGQFSVTIIEDGATIGAGAILLPGITVGRNATIGAGAVCTRDVAPDTMVWGVPAKRQDIRWYAKDREKDTPNE